MAAEGKPIMLVGIDNSTHSYYALEWAIDNFFTQGSDAPFELRIVHARPLATSAVGLVGPGSIDFLALIEEDLKRQAQKVVDTANEICSSKSLEGVSVEVVEGDARKVMTEAVDKHHATILVVGSHGYGTMKRVVLGSVSDFCAHHAHCSVMIVKSPSIKNKQ